MVDRHLGDQREGVQGDPLPEHDVFRHGVRLHLGLHLDVEDLERLLSWWGELRVVNFVVLMDIQMYRFRRR